MTPDIHPGSRYRVTARLPALTATHRRYAVQGSDAAPQPLALSCCDYVQPVQPETLERQKRVVEAMARPPLTLLCRAVEWRLAPEFQWVVSELPQGPSLQEVLQQRQSLTIEEVEAFLRVLTEACESAVAQGWPRLQLDAANLFHCRHLGLPRIPAPDVPLFGKAGVGGRQGDPSTTMPSHAADLDGVLEPVPRDTGGYVLPLAVLCCDLLGQPQLLHGGNARFQPVARLNARQNSLLRRALTAEGRTGSVSARAFMDEFFGVPQHQGLVAHTERLRPLTASLNRAVPPLPLCDALTTMRQVIPPPLPVAVPVKQPPVLVTAPLGVRNEDRQALEKLTPVPRLRLVPDGEESPVLALVAGERLTLGRSAVDADFIAQFRPRTNANDGRSRRISRLQAQLSLKGAKVALEESSAVNPSVIHDSPVPGYAEMGLPANFLLAGEYPVEVRAVPSDYDHAREVELPHKDEDKLHGALVIRAGGAGVLLCEAAMVFSDVALHFSRSGRPWFRVESGAATVARFHRMAGQFWLEPVDDGVISLPGAESGGPRIHELILLVPGKKLRIGPCSYSVQSGTPGKEGET